METSQRRVFFQEEAFQRAWSDPGPRRRWFGRVHPRPEALTEAAHFLAGALVREDFHLFHNGGVPLLERRTGDLVEEIILRPAPHYDGLPYLPITVQLHLSHTRLATVRRQYWRRGGLAPHVVATGNLGQLELPPCWVIWHLGTDTQILRGLVDWTERLAIPWFGGFHHAIELHGRLADGCVPLVRTDTALELMLAHYGAIEASVFLERSLRSERGLESAVMAEIQRIRANRAPLGFEDDVVHNLAVVASSFKLLGS
ncbi:hypothetical protein [Fimbriimonas ginsengisoli]|uniref:Uncharacterized protein n=1 Tax=Fimbriimonas ginsengisoli Gsoil 348 TaxID=661478 RepID=A0A068NJS8_FIMGI|nr:hypothetical protein [Fimbriimonas ginsengisoli]AIE83858.1 hypothetical protein OP10G_0490 [Fimbriimonas ginsengisoli Gsoil 348]